MKSAVFCEHANECPAVCPCLPDCYCKEHTCAPRPARRRTFTSSIYVRNEGQFLLAFHKRFNLWVPVGGEREGDETPQECALRELREETGIRDARFVLTPASRLISGTPEGFLAYEEHDARAKGWHMNFAFLVEVPTRVVVPCDEHTALGWFTGEEPELAAPPGVRSLLKLARGIA